MSGGTFDYKQYSIMDIADQIKSMVENNDVPRDFGYKYDLSPEALAHMAVCEKYIRLAADLAHHADYRYAGDHGDEDFVARVKEAFEKAGIKPEREDP